MPRTQILTTGSLIALTLCCSLAAAQDAPKFPGPEKEHQWLQKFVGEWTTTSKALAGPDQPAFECTGTIRSKMLGGFWVVNEMTSVVQEAPMQGLQTIGYDPAKKKYVGTWVDSMMNHLWKYEGAVDETGKILMLDAEGPSFTGDGKTAMYRDSYEFKTPDHIILTSSMLGEDGKWIVFMTGEAKRVVAGTDKAAE